MHQKSHREKKKILWLTFTKVACWVVTNKYKSSSASQKYKSSSASHITIMGHFRVAFCCLPLYQNESKCETSHMKMSSAYRFIFMQIKLIFTFTGIRDALVGLGQKAISPVSIYTHTQQYELRPRVVIFS